MSTLILVRHGLTAMTGPVLAGWTPGVRLNDQGQEQAQALARRLAPIELAAVVSSPLERCRETAQALVAGRNGTEVQVDERFGEVRYGDWTGQPIDKLVKEPLWKVVQAHPSAARFPGPDGESLLEAQHRAVTAVRDWNDRLGADATYLVCTHGDIIKAVVADAFGLHLDQFQRIQADPASLSVIRYTELRPFVVRLNDSGASLANLVAKPGDESQGRGDSDAAVGGGA